jgi:hypothetical protein
MARLKNINFKIIKRNQIFKSKGINWVSCNFFLIGYAFPLEKNIGAVLFPFFRKFVNVRQDSGAN